LDSSEIVLFENSTLTDEALPLDAGASLFDHQPSNAGDNKLAEEAYWLLWPESTRIRKPELESQIERDERRRKKKRIMKKGRERVCAPGAVLFGLDFAPHTI